jgi:hypothetical protein
MRSLIAYRPLAPENNRFKSDAAVTKLSAVVYKGTGSATGTATNEAAAVAGNYSGAPSTGASFVGIALVDVVNFDLTKGSRAGLKPTDSVIGETFAVSEYCEVLTDQIVSSATPAPDLPAYLGADSKFDTTQRSSLAAVGEWCSAKDASGRALIRIKAI